MCIRNYLVSIKQIMVFFCSLFLLGCGSSSAQLFLNDSFSSDPDSSYDSVIVRYKNKNKNTDTTINFSSVKSSNKSSFSVQDGTCADVDSDPNVVHCEPNYPVYATALNWENDHQAYAITIPQVNSNTSMVIAVLDSGVDVTHPDLKNHIWINEDEIANNGLDDDGNGYIDDYHGVDFYKETFFTSEGIGYTPIGPAVNIDDAGHGTHIAGTIVGINPRVKIMVIKFLNGEGKGGIAGAIRGLTYAIDNGVILSNHSYGTDGRSDTFEKVIKEAFNHLLIAAAGNDGRDIDKVPIYPAAFESNNIISVGASNPVGVRTLFSNYGSKHVDIFAPGINIRSAITGGGYGLKHGTSMAAPFVAGIVSLGMSNSSLSVGELKDRLLLQARVSPIRTVQNDLERVIDPSLFLSSLQQNYLVCGRVGL